MLVLLEPSHAHCCVYCVVASTPSHCTAGWSGGWRLALSSCFALQRPTIPRLPWCYRYSPPGTLFKFNFGVFHGVSIKKGREEWTPNATYLCTVECGLPVGQCNEGMLKARPHAITRLSTPPDSQLQAEN